MIRFLLNNEEVTINTANHTDTVLQYLREHLALTGTKEGCASGDCGACTVVLVQLNDKGDELIYQTVNSCITLLSALHNKQLLTVEHLSHKGQLHPVQQAMVDEHASQCGFCTPGFVMSAFALYQQQAKVTKHDINVALSGNLCRCTGYRPIIDATQSACDNVAPDQFSRGKQHTLSTLRRWRERPTDMGLTTLFMPSSCGELSEIWATHPNAQLVAGSTDLSLSFTQQLHFPEALISLNNIAELKTISVTHTHICIGAAVTLQEASTSLLAHYPALQELIERFASTPIRSQATIGGNVANASPIGDMPPVLLALNATIEIANGQQCRQIPISEFFTGYRQTQLKSQEWLQRILIPLPADNQQLFAYKVSKRLEDDISAVCAVFFITLDDTTITGISSGFGGVASTPVSCQALQNLLGDDITSDDTTTKAVQLLEQAFSPLSDVRASSTYRNQLVVNLWRRLSLTIKYKNKPIPVRVLSHA